MTGEVFESPRSVLTRAATRIVNEVSGVNRVVRGDEQTAGEDRVGVREELWVEFPLLTRMWKTKRARFAASDRLTKRAEAYRFSTSILALYVLALSIAPKYFHIDDQLLASDTITFVTIVVSIFIIILTVQDKPNGDSIRARYMHDNALIINGLYQEYEGELMAHMAGGTKPDYEKFRKLYQSAVDRCPYNHDSIDHEKMEIENLPRANIKSWPKILSYYMRRWSNIILIPGILTCAPLCAVLGSCIFFLGGDKS